MQSYQAILDYLYSQLPMFHRVGAVAYKPNLDNTLALCNLLDNPQRQFKTIHVAGTNGKGSTSHMLAAVLQKAGYKTGLYTSPHLKDFRERIRINGHMIPEAAVVDFITQHKVSFDQLQPSFFEMTVGLCFDYFAKEKIDIAVIEVGLGGRLDATNIINPLLSVITNIGFDHTAILGNTLSLIAAEKAGIIKQNTPVVIGETHPETKLIFLEKANAQQAPIYFADGLLTLSLPFNHQQATFNIQKINGEDLFQNLSLDLTGIYQQKNILTVIQALLLLKEQGITIPREAIYKGLQEVQTSTGLMGRWQTIQQRPLTIVDTGHNPDGIQQVLAQLAITPHQHLHFVLGMMADKDVSTVLSLLPENATYYFCKADIPRALVAVELQKQAKLFGLKGEVYANVKLALEAAQQQAEAADLVLVSGSTFTVAEVL